MKDNETIREIRETRKRISARFGHDPKRLVDYYKEKQKEMNVIQNITPVECESDIPASDYA